MDEFLLDRLSVKELRELKDGIDLAIRAVIRARRESKAGSPAAVTPTSARIDLERERDEWIATRTKVKAV